MNAWDFLTPAERAEIVSVIGQYRGFQFRYRDDRRAFVAECFKWKPGKGPSAYQLDILDRCDHHRKVAVRSLHGIGKTTLAAWMILHFALTRDGIDDWKIPVTASAWRQVVKYLWPEVHKWARQLRWEIIGRRPFDPVTELQTQSLKLSTGEAFGVVSNDPGLIEGAHADQLMFVFDESKLISDEVFNAAEGAFSGADGAEAFALAISTPGPPSGRFYDIHARRPGLEDWNTRHVTLDEAIAAGRVSKTGAENLKRLWGEKSNVYQNRVLGEFAADDSDGIIPLAWVELANERWREWNDRKLERRAAGETVRMTHVGVDVARFGADDTVAAFRSDLIVSAIRHYHGLDTVDVAGTMTGIAQAFDRPLFIIDIGNMGPGVIDPMRHAGFSVLSFNGSQATPDDLTDKSGELRFKNLRAAAYWNLRDLLNPYYEIPIALPPDDKLTGDLVAVRKVGQDAGRVQLESKEGIKKRLGRSPDDGDAVVMAFADDLIRRCKHEAPTWEII